jgi:hypothetical protein
MNKIAISTYLNLTIHRYYSLDLMMSLNFTNLLTKQIIGFLYGIFSLPLNLTKYKTPLLIMLQSYKNCKFPAGG